MFLPPFSFKEDLQVLLHDGIWLALFDQGALIEQDSTVAETSDRLQVMTNEENGLARASQVIDAVHATMLKHNVAHRQRFVDQQNLRIYIDRDGKRQSHEHPAGVSFYRLIDKRSNRCKVFNLGEALVHLSLLQSQDGCVHVNVLTTCKIRIKS